MLLIRNAHVYAPENLGKMDILICEEKILAVKANIAITYDDIEEIDLGGKVVCPGWIDQHVHIIGGGGEDGFASQIPEISMRDCLMNGMTTVVGLLGTDGIVKSPDALVAKTKALREVGMSAYCLTGSYAVPTRTVTGSVGKDIAMIDEVIGVKCAISDHRSSCVQWQELARLASSAYTASLLAKKPGYVHLHTGRGKEGLKPVFQVLEETDLPISQFRPTHMSNQPKDAVKFANMGGRIDFTAGHDVETLHQVLDQVDPKLVTVSTDANGSMPIWDEHNHLIGMGIGKLDTMAATLQQLLKLGRTWTEVLPLVTSNVADALGLTGKKGVIHPQADADLLVWKDGSLDMVIARGKIVVKDGLFCGKDYYM